MSDNKVMQKYYPPEFDPEALAKNRGILKAASRMRKRRKPGETRSRMMEMRMLWPFTIECDNCRAIIFVGTKFNSKVEKVKGEDYLGVPIWKIQGHCPECRNMLAMKTDPKNTDYVMVQGGKRMFDAATAKKQFQEEEQEYKKEIEQADTVQTLKMKALNTAEEVLALERLDNLRRINQRLMARPDELTEKALKRLAEADVAQAHGDTDDELEKFAELAAEAQARDAAPDHARVGAPPHKSARPLSLFVSTGHHHHPVSTNEKSDELDELFGEFESGEDLI